MAGAVVVIIWLDDFCYQLSVIGYWLFVIGYSLLVVAALGLLLEAKGRHY